MTPENNKLFSYIGFSYRSGKIVIGYEKVIETRSKIKLILISSDLGRSSTSKIRAYAEIFRVPVATLPNNLLSELLGGRKIKCIGLTDLNLAAAARNELNKLSEVVIDE